MSPLSFPEQQPDENIISVIRKHYIVFVRIIFVALCVVVFPIILLSILFYSYYSFTENPFWGSIFGLVMCFYALFGFLFTTVNWLDEEFDIFILTDQRLVDITQISFFKRTVAHTPLIQIQDATSSVSGFFPTLLNYGTIDVRTAAGRASNFSIERVANPSGVAKEIMRTVHLYVGKVTESKSPTP